MHEYFYGAQSSTYSFIRVPTVLFTDDQYKYVSAEAIIAPLGHMKMTEVLYSIVTLHNF